MNDEMNNQRSLAYNFLRHKPEDDVKETVKEYSPFDAPVKDLTKHNRLKQFIISNGSTSRLANVIANSDFSNLLFIDKKTFIRRNVGNETWVEFCYLREKFFKEEEEKELKTQQVYFEIPNFDEIPYHPKLEMPNFDEIPYTYSPFDFDKSKKVNIVCFLSFISDLSKLYNKNFSIFELLKISSFRKNLSEYLTLKGIESGLNVGLSYILNNVKEDAVDFLKNKGYTFSEFNSVEDMVSFIKEKGYKVTVPTEIVEPVVETKRVEATEEKTITEEEAVSFLKKRGYEFYGNSFLNETTH